MGKSNRVALAAAAAAVFYGTIAKAELTQLALRFDPAPGAGGGSILGFVLPGINSNGVGAFNSSITGSPTVDTTISDSATSGAWNEKNRKVSDSPKIPNTRT